MESPLADVGVWGVAAALGEASRHPLARALAEAARARGIQPATLTHVAERPGSGMEGAWEGRTVRLGRREFAGASSPEEGRTGRSEIWLKIGDSAPLCFGFRDKLRADAAETVASLKAAGLQTMLLSGDHAGAVKSAAARAGIDVWRAGVLPTDKAGTLQAMRTAGRRVLMVGDGINDAPALAAADVSMSPAGASDIAKTAAGLVFTGARLEPVLTAWRIARAARRKVIENFALAVVYNLCAVPIAMSGHATPLIAAVAMSSSSLLVTGNALSLALRFRLRRARRRAAPSGLEEAMA